MVQRLRIHGIAEVPVGVDDIISDVLRQARADASATMTDVVRATGAHAEEIEALERGAISAFADQERLRQVILAYCDYLRIDPTPLLARLVCYARWQTAASSNLLARGTPLSPGVSRLFLAAFALVMAAIVTALMIFTL